LSQAQNSGAETYFREPTSKIKIMDYFHKLYQTISQSFLDGLRRAKDAAITQYIFVGHSLGGAMASVSAFDAVRSKTITTTSISPVLITYGMPRAGNYAFVNELHKMVPIVFRHVNNWDLVTKIPACRTSNNLCINEFNKTQLDPKETAYKTIAGYKNEFYPWHLGGLIFINHDANTLSKCRTNSEPAPGECMNESSMDFNFHKEYFGYKISDLWKPEQFGYDLVDMTQQQISAAKPYNAIFSTATSQNIISKAAGGTTNWLLSKTGLIAKRKRKMI